MRKHFLVFTLLLFAAVISYAQQPEASEEEGALVFTFRYGSNGFYARGNEAEIARMYRLVDKYRKEIASGEMPVYVNGYCSSMSTEKENRYVVFIRSNRVKSELITNKGLREANFITKNHTEPCDGQTDIVMVAFSLIEKAEPVAEPRPEPELLLEDLQYPRIEPVLSLESPAYPGAEPELSLEDLGYPGIGPELALEGLGYGWRTDRQIPDTTLIEMSPGLEVAIVPRPTSAWMWEEPYRFALRANLYYAALLLPTIGGEWRATADFGIKLDASYSNWGSHEGRVQKIWIFNPEARWYMGKQRRFYFGASGSLAHCNIYGFILGTILSEETGYQGDVWNAGITVGYQARLGRRLLLDLNLGLGYTNFQYETFVISNGNRVYPSYKLTKDVWGPTQVGANLTWTFGR